MMKDSFGRTIEHLRVSITDRCNLRCRYCMPEGQTGGRGGIAMRDMLAVTEAFAELGVRNVRITGGEPLTDSRVCAFIHAFRKQGFRDISMTTNGILLPEYAEKLRAAGLGRVNISLDTLQPDKYRILTRGGALDRVLEGIRRCREAGISPVKINTVLIRGFNQNEFEDFLRFSDEQALTVRFIELMPIGEARQFRDRVVCQSELLAAHPELKRIAGIHRDGPAEYYCREGKRGKIGFISPISCSFCGQCDRMRLDHEGRLIPCLHGSVGVDLTGCFRNTALLREKIREAVEAKPERHHMAEGDYSVRTMNTIGG